MQCAVFSKELQHLFITPVEFEKLGDLCLVPRKAKEATWIPTPLSLSTVTMPCVRSRAVRLSTFRGECDHIREQRSTNSGCPKCNPAPIDLDSTVLREMVMLDVDFDRNHVQMAPFLLNGMCTSAFPVLRALADPVRLHANFGSQRKPVLRCRQLVHAEAPCRAAGWTRWFPSRKNYVR